jgi:hypothetical protein
MIGGVVTSIIIIGRASRGLAYMRYAARKSAPLAHSLIRLMREKKSRTTEDGLINDARLNTTEEARGITRRYVFQSYHKIYRSQIWQVRINTDRPSQQPVPPRS